MLPASILIFVYKMAFVFVVATSFSACIIAPFLKRKCDEYEMDKIEEEVENGKF